MISSEEHSCPLASAINKGLERALGGFVIEPSDDDARNAINSALTALMEVECHRLVGDHLSVEYHEGKAVVTLGGPLARVLSDMFGAGATTQIFGGTYSVDLPGWRKPEPTERIVMTRPYIDPRTNRPTRGKPLM